MLVVEGSEYGFVVWNVKQKSHVYDLCAIFIVILEHPLRPTLIVEKTKTEVETSHGFVACTVLIVWKIRSKSEQIRSHFCEGPGKYLLSAKVIFTFADENNLQK